MAADTRSMPLTEMVPTIIMFYDPCDTTIASSGRFAIIPHTHSEITNG